MKYSISKLVFFFLSINCVFFNAYSLAQDTTIITYIDELAININRSQIIGDPNHQRMGFGLGAYFTSPMKKIVQFQTGIEYNLFRTYEENMYEGHFSSTTDNELSAHIFTLPLNVRINVGTAFKTYIQVGGFLDIVAISTIKGIRTHRVWDSEGHLSYVSSSFKEHGWTHSIKPSVSLSIGNFIKLNDQYFGWKAEYKLGLIPFYLYQVSIPNSCARISLMWSFR